MEKNPEPIKIITLRANGTKRVQTQITGETRTQQQFQDQTDINKIMEQYVKTGTLTHIRNATEGVYADLSNLPSYEEAMRTIIAADDAFKDIPAPVRQRFGNDPQQLMDFLNEPKNHDEAIELGLMTKQPAPKPDPVLEQLQNIASNTKTNKKKASSIEEA